MLRILKSVLHLLPGALTPRFLARDEEETALKMNLLRLWRGRGVASRADA